MLFHLLGKPFECSRSYSGVVSGIEWHSSARLREKHVLVVPAQQFRIWPLAHRVRNDEFTSMQRIVATPILKMLLELLAYLQLILRRDGNVTPVEQAMEIRPQEHAVRYGV